MNEDFRKAIINANYPDIASVYSALKQRATTNYHATMRELFANYNEALVLSKYLSYPTYTLEYQFAQKMLKGERKNDW